MSSESHDVNSCNYSIYFLLEGIDSFFCFLGIIQKGFLLKYLLEHTGQIPCLPCKDIHSGREQK
jgi:hypothetical protein